MSLQIKEEVLSLKQKRKLILRFVYVFLFAILVEFLLVYFIFYFQKSTSIPIVGVVFFSFFTLVLSFIVFVHGRNLFQSKQLIYKGFITKKEESTSKFRNELGQSRYTIYLNDEAFPTDLYFYNTCHVGDEVEIHTVNKNQIFDIIQVNTTTPESFYSVENLEEKVAGIKSQILLKYFYRALFYRFLIGGIAAAFLIFITGLICILTIHPLKNVILVHQIFIITFIISWLLMNRKTVLLLQDLIQKKQVLTTERITDLITSNLPKSGKNSVQTYQGFWYKNDQFYYVETEKSWIHISKEQFEKLKNQKTIQLVRAKKSFVILEIL